VGLFPPPRKRKLRLVMPSGRTIIASLIVLAAGIALAIAYMFLARTEEGFIELQLFSIVVSLLTFIAGYVIDILEHE
jgi:hypothetical protein